MLTKLSAAGRANGWSSVGGATEHLEAIDMRAMETSATV
jgi:hypothetical protein